MKTIINEMIFDTEMVNQLKSSGIQKEILYVQLISGKITLEEYLELSK
jgi:hypothetical protein